MLSDSQSSDIAMQAGFYSGKTGKHAGGEIFLCIRTCECKQTHRDLVIKSYHLWVMVLNIFQAMS